MVLRRPPRKVPEGRNETMLREYRVLDALNGTDVPHREAIAACDDKSVLGACFYLMDHVDGWSPMSIGGSWPAPFDTDLEARTGLGLRAGGRHRQAVAGRLAARGLEGFGKPDGFHERQVDRWLSHLSKFQFRELPGHRRGGRVAAGPQAERLRARHHPRRLPVRQRDVPPRRAGAAGRDRRLGDGDGRRPAARPGVGDDGLARDPDEDRRPLGYVDYTGMPRASEMLAHYGG